MTFHSSELREKDVINVCNGRRLGYVCDFLLDSECRKITAIYVSDHYFGLTGGKSALCIQWDKICCIGDDAILVQIDEKERLSKIKSEKNDDCSKYRKCGWLFT